MASVTSQLVPLESNFLVPNATFFVELAAFALLFFLLAKYVIPPINRAMTARQDAIRTAVRGSRGGQGGRPQGRGGVQGADRRRPPRGGPDPRGGPRAGCGDHRGDARAGAGRGRPHRRARARADRGRAQGTRSRRCGPRSGPWPRRWPGGSSGESLEDDERSGRVVDRFLADLETLEASEAAGQDGAQLMLRGASAEALAELTEQLGRSGRSRDADDARRRAVRGRRILRADAALRRVATDARSPAEAKPGLAEPVFGRPGRRRAPLRIVTDAVGRRWTAQRRPARRRSSGSA